MAPREPLAVFLVEHYRPGQGVEQLRHCVRQIQVQMQETAGASLLCSIVVPTDEAFLLVVAARSMQAVHSPRPVFVCLAGHRLDRGSARRCFADRHLCGREDRLAVWQRLSMQLE